MIRYQRARRFELSPQPAAKSAVSEESFSRRLRSVLSRVNLRLLAPPRILTSDRIVAMVERVGEWNSGRKRPLTIESTVNVLGFTRWFIDRLSASFSGALAGAFVFDMASLDVRDIAVWCQQVRSDGYGVRSWIVDVRAEEVVSGRGVSVTPQMREGGNPGGNACRCRNGSLAVHTSAAFHAAAAAFSSVPSMTGIKMMALTPSWPASAAYISPATQAVRPQHPIEQGTPGSTNRSAMS
ncbi:hypothetical protein L1887_56812 [Cichorium endivia]|nr:hypothetical protein L1887_56812 [Cichorium endivia]